MPNRTNDFENPIPISNGGTSSTNAADARVALGITLGAATILGTANQIHVVNGDGSLGNPTISIDQNPIVPGNEAMTLPVGTNANYPGSPTLGMTRANSDTGFMEFYQNGIWNNYSVTSVNFGQSVTATVDSMSGVSLTSGVAQDITSITVPAGTWDISGNMAFIASGPTFDLANCMVWTSLASALLPDLSLVSGYTAGGGAFVFYSATAPLLTVTVLTDTIIYLSCHATFAAGTCVGAGSISARCVR